MKQEALIDAFDQAGAISGDAVKALTVEWALWLAGNWERIPPADRGMMVTVGGVLFDKGATYEKGFIPPAKPAINVLPIRDGRSS
ncbi:hypothetical protein [Robbsia andropogonis]|uniref:hypothetical protein n=1 Tax=Robbsia andropogonis TaxID=28092 RepID=UPI002A69E861|nr:hypothetical protein [Robbsia andropogonis]